jgi:hypothetical protein
MSISKEYIARFLPPNPIIVEAGAHSGKDTLSMCMLWPSGTIYAFEPIPAIFEQLVERTKECATEVNLIERYKGAPLYQDVRQWLQEQGFSVVKEAIGPHGWGDVLFRRMTW